MSFKYLYYDLEDETTKNIQTDQTNLPVVKFYREYLSRLGRV